MIPYGKRSTSFNPWRYCARCGEKRHISEMDWQRGKLICFTTCWDVKLVGDREAIIAQVIGDGQQEFAPVPKLREPDTTTTTQDDIFI
jgi:hypothetical protein